jgi:hypothetical protein
MHVDYEITEKDYLDGQRLAIKNSSVRMVRWTRFVLPSFGALLAVFLIHGILTQGFAVSVLPGMAFSLFFLLVLEHPQTKNAICKKQCSAWKTDVRRG